MQGKHIHVKMKL